jgi:hypothetical protein
VARAGQVAIATENSIADRAASGRDERGLVLFPIFGKGRNSMFKRWSGYPPKLSVKADISAQRPSARTGREQVQQRGVQKAVYSMTASAMARTSGGIP